MLALVGHAFGASGGIAQYNRDFLGGLVASGLVSGIDILPRHGPKTVETPPKIVQHGPRFAPALYAAGAIAKALSTSFDMVFCGHLYMAPLAAVVARLGRAKLVIQTHGIEAWPQPTRLQRNAVERADLVLSVSRFTRAKVLSWAAMAPEKVAVLPDTVGEAFTPGDGSALRARWGLAGKRVLLTVGRMDGRERYKGHDRTIRALPALIQRWPGVTYVVLGEGDDRARLQALAEAEGVEDHVKFMGPVDEATLIDAYRMADVFVMPSTGEGFGIAYLEAMACGTPAIGLDAAGARDAFADGRLSLLATESGLLDRLRELLNEPKPDPEALASAVRQRFGKPVFVAEQKRLFDRLHGCASTGKGSWFP
jgi:phosphatidylinositol alpha-1,6-mannosyltransferase